MGMKTTKTVFRIYEIWLLIALTLFFCVESLLDAIYMQNESELAPMIVARAIWLALIIGAFSRYVVAIRILAFACGISAITVGFSLPCLATFSPVLAGVLCVGVVIKASTGIYMLHQISNPDSFGAQSLDAHRTPH